MDASTDLRAVLRAALPPALADQVAGLAQVLTRVQAGQLAPDAAQQHLAPYTAALQALAGRQLATGETLLSFGVGNQFGHVSIGDIAGHTLIKLTIQLPHAPAGPAFQTPYPPNPLFTGRTDELDALAAILLDPQAQTAALLPAITGLGGIGKTQLAAEFTHRYRDRFPGGIFWLNMAQPETVAGQVAACAGPGGLDLPDWPALDFEARLAAEASAAIRASGHKRTGCAQRIAADWGGAWLASPRPPLVILLPLRLPQNPLLQGLHACSVRKAGGEHATLCYAKASHPPSSVADLWYWRAMGAYPIRLCIQGA